MRVVRMWSVRRTLTYVQAHQSPCTYAALDMRSQFDFMRLIPTYAPTHVFFEVIGPDSLYFCVSLFVMLPVVIYAVSLLG